MVAIKANPDTFAGLQARIASTAAYEASYNLAPTDYPIVFRENGDWDQYINEYTTYGADPTPVTNFPGICIIDQAGRFYDIRFGDYDVHAGVDWVVRKLNELLGGRRPVDTVLVLDRSGTMGELPPSGGTDPKIVILQDAVGVFLDVWQANAVAGDRVGVVDFSSTVSHYTQPGTGASLASLSTSALTVRNYVDGLTAGGWTAMGGGVATALDLLAGSPRRHIILFSDGMQNYNPVLADVGFPIQILHVDPADAGSYSLVEGIYGDSGVPPKPGQELESFDTHIHTIGVGLTGLPWTRLMQNIAIQTDGLQFQTPAPEVDLQNFYINDLLESFRGATPQLVQHTLGTLDREVGHAQNACWINTTAHWLTVVLSWQGDADRNQLLCNLEAPDGTLIEIHSRITYAPRYCVISMPLPPFHKDRLVDHAGQWRLHIMGTTESSISYQVFWLVDDHHVHFEIPRIDRLYRVREEFPFKAQLLLDGEPMPPRRIQKTQVLVTSPVVDLGQFVNEYKVAPAQLKRIKRKAKELGLASGMEIKLYALSQDKKAVAQCTQTRVRSMPVKYRQGDWVGSVAFAKPGIHRLDLYVSALDGKGSRIVRTRTLNVFVQ